MCRGHKVKCYYFGVVWSEIMHTFDHLGYVLPNGMKQGGVKLTNSLERFVLIKFTRNQMFWSEIKSGC